MAEVNLIFRLAGLAILITVLYSFLKQAKHEEYANLTILAGLAIMMLMVIPLLVDLFNTVRSVFLLY